MSQNLKVALVHDYLAEYGGAERVLEALHDIYPDAPLFTSFVDEDRLGTEWQRFAGWDIRQSWLTAIPFYKKLFSPLRFLAPAFFRSFDLSGYDVIISSTNAYFAKAIKKPAPAIHICYCHTPSRSLWGYSTMTDWKKNVFMRIYGQIVNHYLRMVDVEVSYHNVDVFIANSEETARRIKKFYRRDSTVIYPPVDVAPKLPASNPQGKYYLFVSRLAWAKHPELAIAACNQLGLPLKVVGTGKLFDDLKKQAGPTVEMLGFVPDDQLSKLYDSAIALIYPAEDEDFGIVPVEAMGHGVPVIAHRSGGPQETVIKNKTGIFFDQLTTQSLIEAIGLLQKIKWNHKLIHQHALNFGRQKFIDKIRQLVDQSFRDSAKK